MQKFNEKSKVGKCPHLEEVYGQNAIAFTQWGNLISKRVKNIQDNFVRPLKFAKHEWTSLKDLCELRKNIAHDYLSGWKDLENKKKKLFERGDVSKWELDPEVLKQYNEKQLLGDRVLSKRVILNEETRILKNIQNVFGYVNSKLVQEFQN